MPKKYDKNLFPNLEIDVLKVMQSHPNISLNGLAAIKSNSIVEALLPNLFAKVLGIKPAYGLGSILDKEEDFLVAAKKAVGEQDLLLINKVFEIVGNAREQTQLLINGLWGLDKSYPESIVIMDAKSFALSNESTDKTFEKNDLQVEDAAEIQNIMRDGCTIWNSEDMGNVRNIANQAFTGVISLGILLKNADEQEKENSRNVIRNILNQK